MLLYKSQPNGRNPDQILQNNSSARTIQCKSIPLYDKPVKHRKTILHSRVKEELKFLKNITSCMMCHVLQEGSRKSYMYDGSNHSSGCARVY